jgi:acyl-CoA thioesterase FadM
LTIKPIFVEKDDTLVAKAVVHIACVDVETGRAYFPDELRKTIKAHSKAKEHNVPNRLLN